MKTIKMKKFISFVLTVMMIFGMFTGVSASENGYTPIEGIDFPTFDEWRANTYVNDSKFSAFSTEMPIAGADGFIAPIEPPDPNATRIYNAQDLDNVRNNLSGSYVLMKDIDLSTFNGGQWTPIGDNSTNSNASRFTGTFDGQGYVIKNLTIGTSEIPTAVQYAGLFGYTNGVTIKNVGLEDTYINISSSGKSTAGGIGGYVNGTIVNCYNTGNISADGEAGGIYGTGGSLAISNCYNTGDISAIATGGIGGMAGSVTISNCYNTGDISAPLSATISAIGGICGYVEGTISNCYNTGDIYAYSSDDVSAGGIGGYVIKTTISNCYNTGNISIYSSDSSYTGGISAAGVGIVTISNCYNTGDISVSSSDSSYTGGIHGYIHSSDSSVSISNCYWNSESEQMVNGSTQSPKKGVGNGTDITTSLTSEEMKNTDNFVGFDFDTVWGFKSSVNNDYPVLQIFHDFDPNFTALLSKIEEALTVTDNGIVSVDGSELWEGAKDKFWVTVNEKEAFYEALINSYEVIDKTVSQGEVNLAVVNLGNAIQTFIKAKKVGTGTFDYSILLVKIDEAIAEKGNVIISVDGSELSKDESGKFWVSQAEYDEFDELITNSYEVIDKAVNQVEIDLAVVSLAEAIQTFIEAKKVGTGVGVAYDNSNLKAKIKDAYEAKANVIVSTDGSELSELTGLHWWVTQDVMNKFNNAILKATNTLVSTNQAEIEAAESELDAAITEFTGSRQIGTGVFATTYEIEGSLIADVLPKTSVLMFASNFTPADSIDDFRVNVYNTKGELIEGDATVGTGMIVKIIIAGEIVGEFEAVIPGDLTGRGNPDIEDAKVFLEYLVGNKTLEEAYKSAADGYDNGDSAIKKLRAFLNFVTKQE